MFLRANQWAAVGLLLVALPAYVGCGGSPYPEPSVRSAQGNPGKCAACGKEIPLVGEGNMVTVGATQFVVCDSACGTKLTEKMKNQ